MHNLSNRQMNTGGGREGERERDNIFKKKKKFVMVCDDVTNAR